MKSYLILLVIIMAGACSPVPHADRARVGDAVSPLKANGNLYVADTLASFIEWVGTKPGGKHHGTFKLSGGELWVQEQDVQGGLIYIRIASLNPDDKKAKSNETLREHLLSDDFFDQTKFPQAVFEITDVAPKGADNFLVSGNLTLKNVVKNIKFPAAIKCKDARLVADAAFELDRTLWGMHYGNDRSLGDWFIRPDVYIKLHLEAKR